MSSRYLIFVYLISVCHTLCCITCNSHNIPMFDITAFYPWYLDINYQNNEHLRLYCGGHVNVTYVASCTCEILLLAHTLYLLLLHYLSWTLLNILIVRYHYILFMISGYQMPWLYYAGHLNVIYVWQDTSMWDKWGVETSCVCKIPCTCEISCTCEMISSWTCVRYHALVTYLAFCTYMYDMSCTFTCEIYFFFHILSMFLCLQFKLSY